MIQFKRDQMNNKKILSSPNKTVVSSCPLTKRRQIIEADKHESFYLRVATQYSRTFASIVTSLSSLRKKHILFFCLSFKGVGAGILDGEGRGGGVGGC